jgi:hypothetical protein
VLDEVTDVVIGISNLRAAICAMAIGVLIRHDRRVPSRVECRM